MLLVLRKHTARDTEYKSRTCVHINVEVYYLKKIILIGKNWSIEYSSNLIWSLFVFHVHIR